jgi:hypothetical protein
MKTIRYILLIVIFALFIGLSCEEDSPSEPEDDLEPVEKAYIDTLWIEEDARIDCSDCNWDLCDSNDGQGDLAISSIFSFEQYYDSLGYYYSYECHRANRSLIKLPYIDTTTIDSVFLRVSAGLIYSTGNCCVEWYYITEDWAESTVTWNTMPSLSADMHSIDIPNSNDSQTCFIDVTDYFKSELTLHGIMLKYYREFSSGYTYELALKLGSSENPSISDRPILILYKSN